jgi:hypothetical protein
MSVINASAKKESPTNSAAAQADQKRQACLQTVASGSATLQENDGIIKSGMVNVIFYATVC